ncbi:MAG: porin [Candidatus Aminicenantales bacterium]
MKENAFETKLTRRSIRLGAAVLGILICGGAAIGQEKETKEPSLAISKAFKLSGYTQVQYTGWDTGNDSFFIRRSRISLGGGIIKNMQLKVQVDLAKTPTLLDAYIDYSFNKYLSVRVGQFQVPFSLESLTGSGAVDTINRSQPEEKLVPGRDNGALSRDAGVMVFGTYALVDYSVGLFNGSGINKNDANSHKDIGGRVVVHPVKVLAVGGSFYKGKQGASTDAALVTRDKYGLEAAFILPRVSVKAEYFAAKDDLIDRNGWYVQGGYFVLPKKVQAILKYETVDMNRDLALDGVDRYTAGLNWFIAANTKIQVNYELYKGESDINDNSAFLAFFQVGF